MDSAQERPKGSEPEPSGLTSAFPYRRILIYGVTGAGKTTMARLLSEQTGIQWTEVDSLTWEPGWVEVPKGIQELRIREICAKEAWILDSAYGKWIDIPLERADLIIGLDYSRVRSFRQLLWRSLKRVVKQEKVCNGNIESFKKLLSKDSLLLWHLKSFSRKRKRLRRWATDPRFDVKVLRKPKDLDCWLVELQMSVKSPP